MKKKNEKKEALLASGVALMTAQGFNATGIKEIVESQKPKMQKGSFYNYFDSKEDFTIQVIQYYMNEQAKTIRQYLENTQLSPRERINNFFETLIQHYTLNCQCQKGCLIGNLSQEIASNNDNIRQYLYESSEKTIAQFHKILVEAQSIGELNSSRNPETLARFIWNSWEGAILRMKTTQSSKDLRLFKDIVNDILLR